MIIAKTKLKKIPEKCTNCKLSVIEYLSNGNCDRYCGVTKRYLGRVKVENHWTYIRPKWCPLIDIEKLD